MIINFFRQKLKLIIILAISFSIGFFGYRYFFVGKNGKKIESAKVRKGALEEKLTISGTIDAEEKVTLRFKTSGRLSWVGVKEGDYVKKYQAIASLDSRELKKQLEKELNDYMSKRWDFDNTTKRDDWTDKFVTDNSMRRLFDKAQFDLNNAVLDVEIQNLALEYANLWTPIEGIVTRVAVPYSGVNITPAQAEFDIVNPNTIYFSALADQTEVTKLYEGMEGELVLDAYPEEMVIGNIKKISFTPKTGETGTVYEVKFNFPNENQDYRYRMGMAGDLSFVTKRKEDILYIPLKFVKSEQGKKYVEVLRNGKKEKTYIQTGMETDTDIEVTAGLKEGERIYN